MMHSVFVIFSFLCLKMKKCEINEIVSSVVLSTGSHWLCYISSLISNSANLFLMNFSRARYPGQFLQWLSNHSRLVASHTTIAIKSLYVMSNFGTSTFSSSDFPPILFNCFLFFALEQNKNSQQLNLCLMVSKNSYRMCTRQRYSHRPLRTKLAEVG